MLPSPLTITPVGAVTAASPAVAIGDGRQAAFQRALQSLVGQSVTGEVLSRFNDGSFMVNVAEHAVRMQLPADASVGSRLPLTVLSAEPRATFELKQPSSSVVLYGDAHTPAGTGDLYGPPAGTAGSSNAAASGATSAAAAGAGTASAANHNAASGTSPNTGATSATNAAAMAAQAERGAAGQPAVAGAAATPAAAASAAGIAAQLAAAAGYPALAAGVSLNGAPVSRNNSAGNPLAGASDDEAAGTSSPRPAGATAANAGSASHAAASASNANGASQTGRVHSAAASLLGKAPLTPVAELPGLDAGTSQPELSTTARILGSVLSQPAAASALPLLGKTALFSQGAPEPAQLAQTLQSSIEDSGLFYESHVAAWSRGERTLEQLQREPQMQQARAAAANSAAEAATVPDRSAAQQINQQLLAHEQGRVQWQGEAWPGQPMQWEIQRQNQGQPRGQSNTGQEPTPVWRSSLKLRFAALGELSATITMVGQQVHLQLQTGDAASGATLRAQADVLQQSMAAAGIPLSSCNIQDGPDHDG